LVAHKNVLESKDISRSYLRRKSTTISKGGKNYCDLIRRQLDNIFV
jgi:hypothetical protein